MGRIIWEGQIPNTGNFANGWDFFSNLPFTRVEGGHRVVDIDQDIFPVLNVEPRSSYQGITLEVQISGQLPKCITSQWKVHSESLFRRSSVTIGLHRCDWRTQRSSPQAENVGAAGNFLLSKLKGTLCFTTSFLLQTLDCLQLDLDLGLGIGNSSQQQQEQPEAPPPRRVDSVIRAVPVPVVEQVHTHQPPPSAGAQRHPDDRTKGDLIAEKLKLLASDRSDEGFASKKNQEDGADQDLLSLLGEPQLMLQQPTMDSLNNFMWEVKEEEVSPS